MTGCQQQSVFLAQVQKILNINQKIVIYLHELFRKITLTLYFLKERE